MGAEPLNQGKSERVFRCAQIASLAEKVFGSEAKASRWLRKPKLRFAGLSPLEVMRTEDGVRQVEEMLLQLDHGMAA